MYNTNTLILNQLPPNVSISDLNLPDLSYNLLIDPKGIVYEGVGWGKVGYHTQHWNTNSTGIAIIGTYNTVSPSAAAMNALQNLIKIGIQYKVILD